MSAFCANSISNVDTNQMSTVNILQNEKSTAIQCHRFLISLTMRRDCYLIKKHIWHNVDRISYQYLVALLSYPIPSCGVHSFSFSLCSWVSCFHLQKSLFMGLDKCWAYISDLGFSYCLYILLLYLFLHKYLWGITCVLYFTLPKLLPDLLHL